MREPSTLTSSQLAGRDARCADQDRTLDALHDLEAALGCAAPGRESSWRAAVLAALVVLEEATDDEYANATNPDSLLSDIKRTQPRLRTRVRGLRTQYAHLRQTITAMRAELAKPDDHGTDFADVRHRLAWLLTALRHQRARESDLIYEAYYDAFDTALSLDCDPNPSAADGAAATPAGTIMQPGAQPGSLGPALESNGDFGVVVHQAAGMVAVQLASPFDDALLRLRDYARSSGRTVSQVAADVVARRLRLDDPVQ